MAGPEDLRRAANQQATQRSAEAERFLLRLSRIVSGKIADVSKELIGLSPQRAAARLGSLMEELRAAGLFDELAKLQDIYAVELSFVASQFREQGIKDPLTPKDEGPVVRLIDFDRSAFEAKLIADINRTRSELMRASLASDEEAITSASKQIEERISGRYVVELEDSVTTFGRAITADKATELGFDLLMYLGPDDQITRDFCGQLLDKDPPIYTVAEVNAMDNGTDLPVITSGGGYNCRHQWRPVSEEFARELGWSPDE